MYNQNAAPDPKNFVKTNVIIHFALLVGQVLFGIAVFFITQNPVVDLHPVNDVFIYVAPFMIVFTIVLGTFLYNQQLKKVTEKTTIKEKLSLYQTAFIIRDAMSEGASLFCIVCVMNTGNLVYLIAAGINIIYFIWIRPTKAKIEDSLNLDYNEKAAMES